MKKHTILLVDDEKIIRMAIGNEMRDCGYEVVAVESGTEAINILSDTTNNPVFDLVITDLMLEDMTGIDVLKASKEIDPLVMVLILTGYASLESAISAIDYGVDDYVQKTRNSKELHFKVARCLERSEFQRKVKLYEKILHVCCVCDKICDDRGHDVGVGDWMAATEYVQKAAKVELSHSYCPECLERLHPGIAADMKGKT